MVVRNPEDRVAAKSALEHPFFRKCQQPKKKPAFKDMMLTIQSVTTKTPGANPECLELIKEIHRREFIRS